MFSDSTFENVIWIAAIVVAAVCLVSGLGLLVMWVKYSLIRRTNSAGYTGRDLTQKLFNDNGEDAQIVDSMLYAKYWNHNKRKNTYRLRQWTSRRSSIWTMMEASQQAYATIIRKSEPSKFWMAFRLPRLISLGGTIVGFGLIAWGIHSANVAGGIDNPTLQDWIRITSGFTVMLIAMLYAEVWKAWILRKNVPELIKNSGLNDDELKAIKRIFTWALVYAIANAILQTLRVVLEISRSKNDNN